MLPDTIATSISPGAPVGSQLHGILRDLILRNDLPPGTRLSESELAARFAVSRQPVREAFIKLSEEGLLEVRPQRGTFVRRISQAAVMDARFVREAIEADIVKLLAEKADQGLVRELRQQLAEQREAARTDASRFIKLDELFHKSLADAAGKGRAWMLIEGLKVQMDRVRYLSLLRFPMVKLTDQHEAIVDAIGNGDQHAAEMAVRGHLREILSDLPAIFEDRPEFFEEPGR
ncbi:GntR family transcriptional regulator [Martelella endophytica]|uniref:GntR family transcriptional regulator n=1 Tax=Martelella endophytica TaxID=1486262 RepID=A0A0D5LUB4_MAREN|nr:GntR family transcriptional regulator [Martelella endophytica]AJY47560.1 GntR family transcriptional regulator [Martelella endophytica]